MTLLKTIIRLLILIVVLNLIRYFVIGLIEAPLILGNLFEEMAKSSAYFRTDFTTFDWVTSYLYNFLMWALIVIAFHFSQPHLKGNRIVKSLVVFGFMWMFFSAVSLIYMNHYSHPRMFYVWSILDGALVFALLGAANGLLYPILFPAKKEIVS